MYAPRQRGVEPASTNRSSHHSYCMDRRTRERVQALTGLHVLTVDHRLRYLGLTSKLGGRPPPMYDGSIPSIGVKAATAAGSLPYPSRTRKISPPAFRPVLECANLWETRFAASHSYYPHTAVAVWGFFRSAASRTATLNPPQRLGATAPRWQSPAQRIRLQSGTPAGSNPALGSLRFLTNLHQKRGHYLHVPRFSIRKFLSIVC